MPPLYFVRPWGEGGMLYTRTQAATLMHGSCQFLLRESQLNLQRCHIAVTSNYPGLVYTVVRESRERCRIYARSGRVATATVNFTITIDDSKLPSKAAAKPCNCGAKRR
jgi:hypothetical protein